MLLKYSNLQYCSKNVTEFISKAIIFGFGCDELKFIMES